MAIFGLGEFGSLGQLAAALTEDETTVVEGLEALDDDSLIGLMASIDGLGASATKKKAAKKKVVAAARKKGSHNISRETTNLSDKALFEQRINLLPKDAQTKLKKGVWQIVPFIYYGVEFISQQNHVDIFKSGDNTVIGITNVVQGRMPAEDYFLATRLRVRSVSGLASRDYNLLKTAQWTAPIANITNGEWHIGQESTTYIDKSAASVFEHANRTDQEAGLYILPTPKMFYPQREINVEFDFAGIPDESAQTYSAIRVDIIGVKTTKA